MISKVKARRGLNQGVKRRHARNQSPVKGAIAAVLYFLRPYFKCRRPVIELNHGEELHHPGYHVLPTLINVRVPAPQVIVVVAGEHVGGKEIASAIAQKA